MKRLLAGLGCGVLLGLAVFACTGGGGSTSPTGNTNGPVTTASGVEVSADVIAATLGDDCAASSGLAKCDPSASGDFAPGAPGAPGGCGGSFCQQSNMQLLLTAGPGSTGAKIEIVSVVLVDAKTDAAVDTLVSRDPTVWTDTRYVAWDEIAKPSSETKASYNLSAPNWGSINGSYSEKYKLRVTLKVDGVAMTIESAPLNREPQVAT